MLRFLIKFRVIERVMIPIFYRKVFVSSLVNFIRSLKIDNMIQSVGIGKMASRVFASLDLVRLIYSFGDPNHRKFTHELKWDLKPWPEVIVSRYTERRLIVGVHTYTLQDYLHEFSDKQIERMVKTYTRCYCCQRHNTDKPTFHQGHLVVPHISVFESCPDECTCSCRSLSRRCVQAIQEREDYAEDPED
jgi:hypothetical protein